MNTTIVNDPLQNILDRAGEMFDGLTGYIQSLFAKNREIWVRRIKTVEDVLVFVYEFLASLRRRLASDNASVN